MGKIKSFFNVWDKVVWKTGIGDILIKKVGEIICVLEPGEDFYIAVKDLEKSYKATIIYSGSPVRDHLSYIVLVKEKGTKSKIYWPEINLLRKYKPTKRKKKFEVIEDDGEDWGELPNLQEGKLI